MKITAIDVYDSKSNLISALTFRDATRTNSFLVKAILGLDVDEIVPQFHGYGSYSKKKMYNMVIEEREVTVVVALNPSYSTGESISSLRDRIYKAVAASRNPEIQLKFREDSTVKAVLRGLIKKIETDQFAQTPEMKLVLTCPDPMLKAPSQTIVNAPVLGAGNTFVDDESTAPHGFEAEFVFSGPCTNLIIQDKLLPTNEWRWEVTPGTINFITGFQNLDRLYISSVEGNRYVYMTRDGVINPIYLADKISASAWPIIYPGSNTFYIMGSGSNYATLDKIKHTVTYWGL